jgi:hypothetical protein
MAIDINIGSKLDGKGFKQADTAINKLNKGTKNLARNFGLAFGTAAVLAYGRASAKAFAEDDKAATSLATTLKNLNLAYGSNIGTVNGFISRLEQQTGVLDDELRPAMDRLLRATGDVAKSQQLLNLALDIAAGTGKSVTQVSQSLQKAYLGQTQALGRLGVGLSKAELSSSSFEQIQERLNVLFAGQATAAADSYAGALGRLAVASNNAKETIGKGLFDALKTVSGSTTTDEFIAKIDKAANSIANFLRETGKFIAITKDIFKFELFATDPKAFKGMGNVSVSRSSQDTQKADALAKKNATATTKLTKEQAAAQAKILKDKKLTAAIDKANLALNKGGNVFDIDKIQNAAALANQAELLGRATDAAQILQIANDTARLNVKRSMLALEEAIASKDEAAITAATAKLNADLGVLNALTGQNTQMAAIKSILEGLKPKELIDQANLDQALAKIREMLAELAKFKMPTISPSTSAGGPFVQTPNGISPTTAPRSIDTINAAVEDLGGVVSVIADNGKEFIQLVDGLAPTFQTIEDSGAFNNLVKAFIGGDVGSFDAGTARAAEGGSIFNSGGTGAFDRDVSITVNTGVGDPNAIAEAVTQIIQDAIDRGTLRGGVFEA